MAPAVAPAEAEAPGRSQAAPPPAPAAEPVAGPRRAGRGAGDRTDASPSGARAESPPAAPVEATPLVPPAPPTPDKTLPPRVDLAYKVFLGTQGFLIGEATYRFEHEGNRYRISTVAQARGLAALFIRGRGKVESRGLITPEGLVPQEFTVERGSSDRARSPRASTGTPTPSRCTTTSFATLTPPSFDPMTVMWQAYFTPPTESRQHVILVTTRRVVSYIVEREATETIEWPHGEIETERWHRRSNDGSIDAYFWLAPKMHYALVKMRVTQLGARHRRSGARRDPRRRAAARRVSAAGPPQGARPPGGKRRAAPFGGDHASARAATGRTGADAATAAVRANQLSGPRRRDRARRTPRHAGRRRRSRRSSARTRRWASATARSSPTAHSRTCGASARSKRSRAAGSGAASRSSSRCASSAIRCAISRARCGATKAAWLADLKQSAPAAPDDDAIAADVPDWLWQRLLDVYGETERAALTRAWHAAAPFDLRVNPLKATREDALAALAASGIDAVATPYAPLGIRVHGRPSLVGHPWLADGRLEVQDEGSQLIGYLVAPRRADMVVDFCAGAGGKTLLLGALMRSQGRLYAFDVSAKRLANFAPRLKRSGLSNVHPQAIANERDVRVKRLAGKIDRVLVDAPCTGFGTLRRNPDLKWRQQPADVVELAAKQARILAAAATLVKPGGRLVYATCSVLPEENDAIVDAFLAAHPQFAEKDAVRGARARRHRARHRTAAATLPAPPRLRRLLRRDAGAQRSDACARAPRGRAGARLRRHGRSRRAQRRVKRKPPAKATLEALFTPGDPIDARLVALIDGAKREVLVQAFSFTSKRSRGALLAAHRRGVAVAILADRAQTLELAASAVPGLARDGVPVWLDANFIAAHNKVLIVDADGAVGDARHRQLQLHLRSAVPQRRERADRPQLPRARGAIPRRTCCAARKGAALRRRALTLARRQQVFRLPGMTHGKVNSRDARNDRLRTIETALSTRAGWVELGLVAVCLAVRGSSSAALPRATRRGRAPREESPAARELRARRLSADGAGARGSRELRLPPLRRRAVLPRHRGRRC